MSNSQLIIEKGSPYCSIQANPRLGLGQYGIPPSGPMDSVSFRGANYLVGNSMWSPCMEITVLGPMILFEEALNIALAGAEVEVYVNDRPIKLNQSFIVQKGDRLKFGKFLKGKVLYLAIGGKIMSSKIFGNASTLVSFQLGTIIQSKMRFSIVPGKAALPPRDMPNFMKIEQPDILTLRTLAGPEEHLFSKANLDVFYNQVFSVSKDGNRMGCRLIGEQATVPSKEGIISSGITRGTIQIPKSGQPIVMMPDHQTAGGYPRIANVITNDLDYLGQCSPGGKIRFRKVTLEKAIAVLKKREDRIGELFHVDE